MSHTKDSRVSGIYANLSENLRFLRLLKGLSQERVSEMVHTSRKHYCDCENGTAVPSLITICILADIYDVPIDSLISSVISYEFVDSKSKR